MILLPSFRQCSSSNTDASSRNERLLRVSMAQHQDEEDEGYSLYVCSAIQPLASNSRFIAPS